MQKIKLVVWLFLGSVADLLAYRILAKLGDRLLGGQLVAAENRIDNAVLAGRCNVALRQRPLLE